MHGVERGEALGCGGALASLMRITVAACKIPPELDFPAYNVMRITTDSPRKLYSTLDTIDSIQYVLEESQSRSKFWSKFISAEKVEKIAEIGVYKGDLAEKLLNDNPCISTYYMIDPWRSLSDWNKPANKSDSEFEQHLQETKSKTEFAEEKRVILRGKTAEVIDEIPDGTLDFAYIDGDHTLKGITIDLFKIYPKIREGGWIAGDDFNKTIWMHDPKFEPTLVFPYVVYFAEAIGSPVFGLPKSQFLIHKKLNGGFSFIDFANEYPDLDLLSQVQPRE